MLTGGDLAGMRATINAALPDKATIQRKTSVSDGGGGQTESWASLATGVACGIAPVAGGEGGRMIGSSTAGGRVVDETTHIVTLPNGQDITEADRVVVNNQVYDVTLVRKRGLWELSRRVEVKEAP